MQKVKQFENRKWDAVKNQFLIIDEEEWTQIFQSYESTIAKDFWFDETHTRTFIIDPDYCFYSNTTSKYFKQFVGEDIHSICKLMIKNSQTS